MYAVPFFSSAFEARLQQLHFFPGTMTWQHTAPVAASRSERLHKASETLPAQRRGWSQWEQLTTKSINFSLSLGQLEDDDVHGLVRPLRDEWYLQIRNDCTFTKILACRTSPTPLESAGKEVVLEQGIRVQEAVQFCTLSPSLLSSCYWCLGTQRGNQDAAVGCSPLGIQREWWPLETMRITAWSPRSAHYWWSSVMDIALWWTCSSSNSLCETLGIHFIYHHYLPTKIFIFSTCITQGWWSMPAFPQSRYTWVHVRKEGIKVSGGLDGKERGRQLS